MQSQLFSVSFSRGGKYLYHVLLQGLGTIVLLIVLLVLATDLRSFGAKHQAGCPVLCDSPHSRRR